MFTIGKLSEKTGLTPDTLRYYEKEKLLQPVDWSEAGYRLYDGDAVRRIRLIRQARECGFRLFEIREILIFRQQRTAPAGEVRRKILEKKRELEKRILTMRSIVRTLDQLGNLCCDETRPVGDCPILTAFQEEVLVKEKTDDGNPPRQPGLLEKRFRRSRRLNKEGSP